MSYWLGNQGRRASRLPLAIIFRAFGAMYCAPLALCLRCEVDVRDVFGLDRSTSLDRTVTADHFTGPTVPRREGVFDAEAQSVSAFKVRWRRRKLDLH